MSNKCNLWFNLCIIAADGAEGGKWEISILCLLIYTRDIPGSLSVKQFVWVFSHGNSDIKWEILQTRIFASILW